MRRSTLGLFGLLVLLGNQLGSSFGMAVAVCVFIILDGIIEEIQKRPFKKIKKEAK